MKREFFTENFEDLLKENADQFKLSPSRKVWHGIYNDLHPGRRWPSALMSLTFIFSLVIIGHLNTEQSQHSYLTNLKKSALLQKEVQPQNKSVTLTNSAHKVSQINTDAQISKTITNQINKINNRPQQNVLENFSLADNALPDNLEVPKNQDQEPVAIVSGANSLHENDKSKGNEQAQVFDLNNFVINETLANTFIPGNLEGVSTAVPGVSNDLLKSFATGAVTTSFSENRVINTTKETATKNEANRSSVFKFRRNSKVRWAYYITPAVSYRTYSNSDVNSDFDSKVSHHPSFGLEIGAVMKYPLTKKLKFISGFQTNYSTYTVDANNTHPVMATLFLYDNPIPYSISSISFYGNSPESRLKLRNYSLQVSLPVGFEYKLAGNNNVQLNAAATVQPTFVAANKAYLLSSDNKNYLTQATLSRKWNMSTNFGTYVSFNSNRLNWQVGPQVHYQLFSSYTNAYRPAEHFINYGIRVGVSRIRP